VGIISRQTKEIRVKICVKRDSETLFNFIINHVPQNKTIITEFWRGYNSLSSRYIHKKVNHKLNFVNVTDRNIHTNTIERLWRELKRKIPVGADLNQILKYVKEFVIMNNFGVQSQEAKIELLMRCLQVY
jgi:hypothetical protein